MGILLKKGKGAIKMMYLFLIIGFILLIKGADYFVEGSSSIAKLLKVPSVVIGLTIVAFGTSAPEVAVSVTAGVSGNSEMALSNVLGSNLFNLLMVVGICAIFRPFSVDKSILKRDYPICILATILLFLFAYDLNIARIEGFILLIIFFLYLYLVIKSVWKNRNTHQEERSKISPIVSILYIIGGLIAIVLGGDLVVDNASSIAKTFGLSQTLIGLTIVAIGTSLPELVTSIVAAKKGESGLALGNVIGSNLFNILFILGLSSVLTPIIVTAQVIIDIILLIVGTILVFLCCKLDGKVTRLEGILCVIAYFAYMILIIIR